jgi:hypothetical protein
MSGLLIADRATLAYPAVCAAICLLSSTVTPVLGRLLTSR